MVAGDWGGAGSWWQEAGASRVDNGQP